MKPCQSPGQCSPTPQADIDRHIKECGVSIVGVAASENGPGFCYTIGLTEQALPELIVFGLPTNVGHWVLNQLARDFMNKEVMMADGMVIANHTNFPLVLKSVPRNNAAEYVCQANFRYMPQGLKCETMQVVLCDAQGLYLWDTGYADSMKPIQPELWHPTFAPSIPA